MINTERLQSYHQPEPNEYITIADITAACNLCGWQTTGPLRVDINTQTPVFDGILSQCAVHHDQTRGWKNALGQHNRFNLFWEGKKTGFASVSSATSTGYFEILPGMQEQT